MNGKMKTPRIVELLAPAKNKEIGKEAILHGADAVYIGISGFSARMAAGNSIEDIAGLVEFAHQYNAKVYVALNTILYDHELSQVEKLIRELYRIHVDAVIVQDMGILQLNLPPIPLHASTQTDNRTVEKVQFLENSGFTQVVLARELSLDQVAEISSQTSVALEVFVHGALCVSYSGQCYISQAITGRSANRGECAQICRLPFDLQDADGRIIRKNAHLLSLKDFNQYDNLEKLLDAGVSSLKIEGRLKDVTYVKNVVAAYRQQLDSIFRKRPEYVRASSGKSEVDFTPNLSKSFNRGFTHYFFNGRQHDIESFESPKSIGEFVGTVKTVNRNWLSLSTTLVINNGDGLCFTDKDGLNGFRVNRSEGGRIFPAVMPGLSTGTKVYRNYDHDFENRLIKKTAERKIAAAVVIREVPAGFVLQISDEDNHSYTFSAAFEKQAAQKPQQENIRVQLSKTGNTLFSIKSIDIRFSKEWFIPSSLLGEWRKQLIAGLLSVRKINYRQERSPIPPTTHAYPEKELTYLGNVSNSNSGSFYLQHRTKILQPAFEQVQQKNVPLMFTKHCIKFALGWCPRETKEKAGFREPFYLINQQNKLKLSFDCRKCEMRVSLENRQ